MSDILQASISEIKKGLLAKRWSAEEITQAYLHQIAKRNGSLNAMVTVNDNTALALAKVIDKKIALGEELPPLAGIPVGVKDMICTKGLRTAAGSKMLDSFVPPYSATVVKNLERAGAIVVGKCNQDEFAMGSSTEFSHSGACANPWNEDYVPGGSSGGSAAAVSSGMATVALGTDTGGSIRQPANFCGVVGVKPTYGRVSRYGVIAFASSLDQVGPMAKSVEDAALVLEQISGHDPYDSTSSHRPVPSWSQSLNGDLSGYKVGLPKEYFSHKMDDDVKRTVEKSVDMVKQAGAEMVEISIPHANYAISIYYLIATSEASSNLARYDGVRFGHRADFSTEPPSDIDDFYSRNRGEGFGFEVKRRIILGTFSLSSGYYDAYYQKACQVRRLLQNDFLRAFQQCDVMLSAVTTTPAFKMGERTGDPLKMYFNDILTTPTNLAGLPGTSVPVELSERGLPIGVQLTASHFEEQKMLDVALAIESQAGFKEKQSHVL